MKSEIQSGAETEISSVFLGRNGPESAEIILSRGQKFRYALYALAALAFIIFDYKIAFMVINFLVCAFYTIVICFRFICVALSMFGSTGIKISEHELAALNEDSLPVYTILVPLYRESEVVEKIVKSISLMDYPSDRLDVKLLLEADDPETAQALRKADLPSCCEILVVPEGFPRTKPRACNYGLARARGSYAVIYDAEDRPEPDQLKKALAAFRKSDPEVVCLQCKLNYYNPDQNWLTRFFTLEYIAWFELFLPGLHRLGVPIPLGGTSNHFRIEALKRMSGWDPHNVTEDCELGIRISRFGYRTLILDSTTWEEANSRLWNWIRQRSRWVKGYIQTHLVYTRKLFEPVGTTGFKGAAGFLFTVGGMSGMLLLNPIYWLIALVWTQVRWKLVYFDYTDATMQSYTTLSKVSWIFFAATLLLFAANFIFILINVAACRRGKLLRLLPYAVLSPVYWVLISIGAWKGFIQLLRRPFYWEKTIHGFFQDENDFKGHDA